MTVFISVMGLSASRHVVPLQYQGVDRPQTKRYPPATDLSRWQLEVCHMGY